LSTTPWITGRARGWGKVGDRLLLPQRARHPFVPRPRASTTARGRSFPSFYRISLIVIVPDFRSHAATVHKPDRFHLVPAPLVDGHRGEAPSLMAAALSLERAVSAFPCGPSRFQRFSPIPHVFVWRDRGFAQSSGAGARPFPAGRSPHACCQDKHASTQALPVIVYRGQSPLFPNFLAQLDRRKHIPTRGVK
jgi:hypothetical protein